MEQPRAEARESVSSETIRRYLGRGESLRLISENDRQILFEHRRLRSPVQFWLHALVAGITPPKQGENGFGFFVRADLPGSVGPKSLVVTGDAIRRYFYRLDLGDGSANLYKFLTVPESATLVDLRIAWRIKQLEMGEFPGKRVEVERAFNILANPDLRECYSALRRDENTAPLFPYAGSGSILVEGDLSADGGTFFAHKILAYKPDFKVIRTSLLLRRCQFLTDQIEFRHPRRKLELRLDGSLLPGLNWDPTWNHWKHWLKTRIHVDATFVQTTKRRFQNGHWIPFNWLVALPSRLRVTIPTEIVDDIQRARTIHALLGEHADVIEKIRAEVEKQPIDHLQVRDWFDHLRSSTHLKPEHVTWHPDYEPYYFEQLRKHAATWFLFRDEYLFIWANLVISEIPRVGHATYTFARPADLDDFLRRYARVTRQDVRRNRDNVATDLGFIGRIVRGSKKKRWLMDVLRQAGETTDYLEVVE